MYSGASHRLSKGLGDGRQAAALRECVERDGVGAARDDW